MKKLYKFFFVLSIVSIILRYFSWTIAEVLTLVGFSWIAFFHISGLRLLINSKTDPRRITQDILIVVSCISIIGKYNFYFFWDLPSLVLIPAFIISSINYSINSTNKKSTTNSSSILLLILIIPILGLDIKRSPRTIFQIGDRYEVQKTFTHYEYPFSSYEAKSLHKQARQYLFSGDLYESIKVNREALLIEENVEILIDLAHV